MFVKHVKTIFQSFGAGASASNNDASTSISDISANNPDASALEKQEVL